MDDLDHLPPEHLVRVLLEEYRQTPEVQYQNLLRQVPEIVLLVPVAPEAVSKSVAVVELLAKE
jgi:uncharacterized membrane protein